MMEQLLGKKDGAFLYLILALLNRHSRERVLGPPTSTLCTLYTSSKMVTIELALNEAVSQKHVHSGYIAERADIADLCFRLQPVEEKGLERFLLCKLIFSFALSHIAFIFFAAAAPKQGNNPGASSPDGWQLNHQPKSIYPRNQGSLKKKKIIN